MASAASNQGTSTRPGTRIMVAGILFQLGTMVIFVLFMLDFLRRASQMNKPNKTSLVIYAMSFSILTIFIRSIYRSIELLQGWKGYLITHERYFIALDGAMMILAVGVYNFVDPAVLLPKVHARDVVMDHDHSVTENGYAMRVVRAKSSTVDGSDRSVQTGGSSRE